MKKNITNLTMRICQLEQQSRSNNVEIQCVPENRRENLIHVVTNISKVVGCNVEDKDIINCTRVAKLDNKNSRPRSIVVQLASTRLRDQLLASTLSYNRQNPHNKLNNSHLGYAGPKTPIFIAEHLSPSNKSLHAAARLKAREKGYRYVWVRNGRIYVRQKENADKILIKNMSTVQSMV
ncbi:unnamed protein product [Arctia plantaginis]|uniref:FP protein C-terminal domain-containing protein n=1 Tax=Arctia plantaginis TaxID=874455 RepID=A0A8S0ZN43_ARCPL|nr:unnamed protein product [Arctia plantaginis]